MVADLSLDKEALKAVIRKTAGACERTAGRAFVMAEFQYSDRQVANS